MNTEILDIFLKLNKSNKLAHFYLFKHTNKIDDLLLNIINIINNSSLKLIDNSFDNLSTNIFFIDGSKETIKKQNIQDVFYKSQFKNDTNLKNIILIKDIDNAAAITINGFLKFIEEPLENIIILATTKNINKILPTIISRAQIISVNLKNNPQNSFNDWTKDIKLDENQILLIKELIKKLENLLINSQLNLEFLISFLKDNLTSENKFLLDVLQKILLPDEILESNVKELNQIKKFILKKPKLLEKIILTLQLCITFSENISTINANFEIQKTAFLIKLRRIYE
ncbi:DNA polymerase-3 subunit delta' [Mycoplasmopsis mustelae]|uniref:DNA polymerase-3 subunit delta n=1 Tax=Mycoplasmopsis mustelae TaxID=171289 RepID=A0A4R7UEG5_9BACT|nr:AAA family ATPase [Mycoplasmopsis mustelae]TDV23564.1 DNA polymerase-3 subunit delta' [Mycoplasmopsis mustelae]